jgi:hypothetical protein
MIKISTFNLESIYGGKVEKPVRGKGKGVKFCKFVARENARYRKVKI